MHKLSVSGMIIFIKYASHVPWPHEVRCAIWIVLANEILLVSAKLRQQKPMNDPAVSLSSVLEANSVPDGGAPSVLHE